MNELHYQNVVRKALSRSGSGGFCMKCSNRFLIGVPDLFVSIPGVGNGFLEVKLTNITPGSKKVTLKVSPMQAFMLRKIDKAGTTVGVLSFMRRGCDTFILIKPLDDLLSSNCQVRVDEHDYVTTSTALMDAVFLTIRGYLEHMNGKP